MSFRVYKFVAIFLPGIPVWSLLMTEGKILPSLRSRDFIIILTSTLSSLILVYKTSNRIYPPFWKLHSLTKLLAVCDFPYKITEKCFQ